MLTDTMTFGIKPRLGRCVSKGKILKRLYFSEAQHCALSSSKWRVRISGALVCVAARVLLPRMSDFARRNPVPTDVEHPDSARPDGENLAFV
ncbi:hypothetical protein [Croceicoccus sp. YJ47]|uniref:hypothetical protein n=1 Tax=Croceicoccus sp. YJ47 TaxID=2798724 RepID=UPI001923F559|nr:hypothetical protein [Croceicoccus sp. YJ47]QQN74295.1 hypothetical protein JD971_00300 [Croceicoccus sp. YJ47]